MMQHTHIFQGRTEGCPACDSISKSRMTVAYAQVARAQEKRERDLRY